MTKFNNYITCKQRIFSYANISFKLILLRLLLTLPTRQVKGCQETAHCCIMSTIHIPQEIRFIAQSILEVRKHFVKKRRCTCFYLLFSFVKVHIHTYRIYVIQIFPCFITECRNTAILEFINIISIHNLCYIWQVQRWSIISSNFCKFFKCIV